MQSRGLHEVLARDRRRYERLLLARMGTALSREDAEDVVSDALIRVQLKEEGSDPPAAGHEQAWFARIVLNLGIDFLRARDGRRRGGKSPRPALVPLSAMEREPAAEPVDDESETESIGDDVERAQTQALVTRVLSSLDPKDVELIKLRHVVGDRVSRDQVARMAGLTVGEFRWRYTRAWRRFVDAVAMDQPTARCTHTRRLLGAMHAGTAPQDVVAEVDAHTLDCVSCRVFARESYRALEAMPFVPAVGLAERLATKLSAWWDRAGPEATAGAGTAAAATGLWSVLSGGTLAGLLKLTVIACSATAVTAGVCAGVVAVMDGWDQPKRQPAVEAKKRPEKPRPTRSPTPVATPRPRALPTATATPRPNPSPRPKPKPKRAALDTTGESEIPAPAPPDATEFNPGATSAALDPAPATDAGGGEFSP